MATYGKKNVGEEDRMIRAGVAGVSALGGLVVKGPFRWVLFALAAVLGATAALGTCPAYSFLGVDSAAQKLQVSADQPAFMK